MRRGLWFAAGAGLGAYAVVRARRVAEAFTVDGVRDRAGAVALGLRMARDEVAQGRAEAETRLRDQLGLARHGTPQLEVTTSSTTGEPGSATGERGSTTGEANVEREVRH